MLVLAKLFKKGPFLQVIIGTFKNFIFKILGQQKSNETFSKIFLILFIQKLSIIYQVCIHL